MSRPANSWAKGKGAANGGAGGKGGGGGASKKLALAALMTWRVRKAFPAICCRRTPAGCARGAVSHRCGSQAWPYLAATVRENASISFRREPGRLPGGIRLYGTQMPFGHSSIRPRRLRAASASAGLMTPAPLNSDPRSRCSAWRLVSRRAEARDASAGCASWAGTTVLCT